MPMELTKVLSVVKENDGEKQKKKKTMRVRVIKWRDEGMSWTWYTYTLVSVAWDSIWDGNDKQSFIKAR